MTGRKHDIVIAGGGLAGGLIALALCRQRPDIDLLVIEASERLGGRRRHTWIERSDDLLLLDQFRTARWAMADFAFSGTSRRIVLPLRSISAEDFDAGLRRALSPDVLRLRAPIAEIAAGKVTLVSGETFTGRTVIDCRGFLASKALDTAWRTSMERIIITPHQVDQPMLVDAGGEQGGDLAFAQVLPVGVEELVLGEHRISHRSQIDRRELSSALEETSRRAGWQGEIKGSVTDVRPLVLAGSLASHYAAASVPGVPLAGSRGLFLHPLTGSSLAAALGVAQAIAAEADLPGDQLAAMLTNRARQHWQAMKVARGLAGRLMTGQGLGAQRAARFADLPPETATRLLGGTPSLLDRLRLGLARV